MKSGQWVVAAAVIATVFAFSGESFARGGGGGGGRGGAGAAQGTQTQTTPAGSQRRDGTFLQTGTTANGSTTRPSNGKGVMNGTGPNATTTATAPQ